MSVNVVTSQPSLLAPVFPTVPLQLPNCGLQLMVHVPLSHVGMPFWVLHTLPQPSLFAPPAPQLVTSVNVVTSQPSLFLPVLPTVPLPLPNCALHVIWHL